MADVTVKMGVSGISQFKQGMTDASASVKTFDAALKANEKQLKATGNAENYMQAQTTLLNGKLEAQRNIVKNAEQALKQMEANGVKTTSKAYQDMQRRLIEAQSGMMDTEQALNSLGSTATDAAGKTDKLQESLGGLNKKISLDQVISGIDSITGAMEKAAKKAVDLGKLIWENITDAARWSDDVNTQAAMLGMDVEDYQAYKDIFDTFAEITVQDWMKAKTKVQKAMLDPTNDQVDVLQALGIAPMKGGKGSQTVEEVAGNWEDMLWDIGQALRDKVASGEITQDMADLYANQIFGKSFASLAPLFDMGKEAFTAAVAVEKETAASKEAIEANAELNDKLIKLKGDFEQLKAELTRGLAPALSKAADAISGLLGNIMAYLKTPEGQKALQDLSTAVSGLFDDLGEIDPEQVVKGFTDVLNGVVASVQWLVDNKDGVVEALKWILGGWAALEVTGGVLDIVKVVEGISGLTNSGAASAAGTAAGSAWGSAFASAVIKAAPWLIGMYTLLNPAATANDQLDLVFANGQVTEAGWQFWKNNQDQWENRLTAVGNRYGDMGTLMNNAEAVNIIANASIDDEEVFRQLEETLGLQPVDINGNVVVPEDTANQISEQIGTVEINGVIHYVDADGNNIGADISSMFDTSQAFHKDRKPKKKNANGIWSVPFDGYETVLHKGERVVPERAVNSSRNFSSNLYVESMYMNNGTDAEGLAAAIAAANRRTMRGYGS